VAVKPPSRRSRRRVVWHNPIMARVVTVAVVMVIGLGVPVLPWWDAGLQQVSHVSLTDRGNAAKMRPGGLRADPPGVVAGGHEQRRRGVDADAVDLEQLRGGLFDQLGQKDVQALSFGV